MCDPVDINRRRKSRCSKVDMQQCLSDVRQSRQLSCHGSQDADRTAQASKVRLAPGGQAVRRPAVQRQTVRRQAVSRQTVRRQAVSRHCRRAQVQRATLQQGAGAAGRHCSRAHIQSGDKQASGQGRQELPSKTPKLPRRQAHCITFE